MAQFKSVAEGTAGYNYERERPDVFTEDGQVMFLGIRDTVKRLLRESGAFMMQNAWANQTGSSWTMVACVERLEELGEIKRVGNPTGLLQHWVYTKAGF